MANAQDTLNNRLDHSLALVENFLAAEIHERIPQRLMDGLLFSLQDLLEQAQRTPFRKCASRASLMRP